MHKSTLLSLFMLVVTISCQQIVPGVDSSPPPGVMLVRDDLIKRLTCTEYPVNCGSFCCWAGWSCGLTGCCQPGTTPCNDNCCLSGSVCQFGSCVIPQPSTTAVTTKTTTVVWTVTASPSAQSTMRVSSGASDTLTSTVNLVLPAVIAFSILVHTLHI
ncbi:hypothetical protein DM01DRAFT_1330824 [Hesseltinella vesiculosa]|uniref:Granulins domain-containing protein n=1 Tax=Hesseltinella vesiculosa TaxID=101127 RepID=A0A1X2GX80_9FUNG|nr:hypothetical protein DM01DRAFT_1330824 [Hesseltinella vesiculosa]